MTAELTRCRALAFDVFGTVLDLGGSLKPHIARFMDDRGSAVSAEEFWAAWRLRQRIEQYQDSLLMLGHSGYLETARRGFVYCLGLFGVQTSSGDAARFMEAWQQLSPYPDVAGALLRLRERYRLAVLSNGEPGFLEHLVRSRIRFPFDDVISVETAGAFKPHPAVYRRAARILELEPAQIVMVSSNSFDVMGARACGYRAVFVNREGLPYEDSPYHPDLTVAGFAELADALL